MAYTEVTPGKGWLKAINNNLKDLQVVSTEYKVTGINGFDASGIHIYQLQFNGHTAYLVYGQFSYTGSETYQGPRNDIKIGTVSSDNPWPQWQWAFVGFYNMVGTLKRQNNDIYVSIASNTTIDKTSRPQVMGLIYW